MHQWILRCLDFRKAIFSIAAVLLVLSSLGLKYLQFDFKLDVMKKGQFNQQVAFITIYDHNLLDSKHLQLLGRMHRDLSKVKLIKRITSLYTAPNIRRYLDDNEWHNVLTENASLNSSLGEVKTDVLDNQLFVGKFINKQADTMLFYLYLPVDKYGQIELESRKQIQQILDQYKGHFTRVFQSGSPEMVYVFSEKSKQDFLICIPMLVILMSVLFGWLFRSVLIAFFPIGLSAYGIICALGMMGWLGIPASELFIVAIVLTLAITVASNAHIIYAYHESARYITNGSAHDKISFVLKKVLLPLLLAAGAALLGFFLDILSFIQVIQNLSYSFALCMIFTTFAILFISPLLLSAMSVYGVEERKVFYFISNSFLKINTFFSKNSIKVVIVLFLISLIGIYCALNTSIESLPYAFFKKNDPMMEDIYFASRQVAGQNTLQVDFLSKEKNAFRNPIYLQKILDEEKEILKISGTSYTYSAADVIASTYQIFLFNDKKHFRIPKDPRILNRFYSELSTQGFMAALVNKDYNKLTMYVTCNIYSSNALIEYKQKIENILKIGLEEEPFKFKVKDFWSEFARIVTNLLILQILSIFTIYLICFIIVGVMFRSIIAGIISVIPNFIPLCIIATVQYGLSIPITTMSVILYSIIVGLSIDETVHVFHSFKSEYLKLRSRELAVKAALKSQVVPVTISSASIALACLVWLSSQFLPVHQLGFLIGIGIFSTWVADLAITPFLLRKINTTKRLSVNANYSA